MFRCFHCDQLLGFDPVQGPVHTEGGAITVVCPDCGWRGAFACEPLSCPDCGGCRLRDDHRALPSLRRRSDGVRLIPPEAASFPAGKFPHAGP